MQVGLGKVGLSRPAHQHPAEAYTAQNATQTRTVGRPNKVATLISVRIFGTPVKAKLIVLPILVALWEGVACAGLSWHP